MSVNDLKVFHPEFLYVSARGHEGFPVVVFERPMWIKPTSDQLADYRRRQKIVVANGGYMVLDDYQIAGRHPLFTQEDCDAMVEAVKASLTDYLVRGTWNGPGRYTFSVSIKPRIDEI